jgi:quercetin dioxygenase-like cupin family protein
MKTATATAATPSKIVDNRNILDATKYPFDAKEMKRYRVFGNDLDPKLGGPDDAKPYAHGNLYCIGPGQENSEHYHPNSIEIVVVVAGSGTCVISRRNAEDTDWDPPQTIALVPGDTFVVPKAALHAYSSETEELRILAIQTPHDILHLWRDESR